MPKNLGVRGGLRSLQLANSQVGPAYTGQAYPGADPIDSFIKGEALGGSGGLNRLAPLIQQHEMLQFRRSNLAQKKSEIDNKMRNADEASRRAILNGLIKEAEINPTDENVNNLYMHRASWLDTNKTLFPGIKITIPEDLGKPGEIINNTKYWLGVIPYDKNETVIPAPKPSTTYRKPGEPEATPTPVVTPAPAVDVSEIKIKLTKLSKEHPGIFNEIKNNILKENFQGNKMYESIYQNYGIDPSYLYKK